MNYRERRTLEFVASGAYPPKHEEHLKKHLSRRFSRLLYPCLLFQIRHQRINEVFGATPFRRAQMRIQMTEQEVEPDCSIQPIGRRETPEYALQFQKFG
jgi:hypothetical protein